MYTRWVNIYYFIRGNTEYMKLDIIVFEHYPSHKERKLISLVSWHFCRTIKLRASFWHICAVSITGETFSDMWTRQYTFVRKRSHASSSARRHNVILSGFWRWKFRIYSFSEISLDFRANMLQITNTKIYIFIRVSRNVSYTCT